MLENRPKSPSLRVLWCSRVPAARADETPAPQVIIERLPTIIEKEQCNDPLPIHPSSFILHTSAFPFPPSSFVIRASSFARRPYPSTTCCNAHTLARGNNSAEKTAFSPRKRGCPLAGTRKTLEFPQCSRGKNSPNPENAAKTSHSTRPLAPAREQVAVAPFDPRRKYRPYRFATSR
jgi:hypothetical protein